MVKHVYHDKCMVNYVYLGLGHISRNSGAFVTEFLENASLSLNGESWMSH